MVSAFFEGTTTMKKYYPYLITVSHMINDSCQSVLPALLPLFIYTYGLSLEQGRLSHISQYSIIFIVTAIIRVMSLTRSISHGSIALGVLLSQLVAQVPWVL